jgi:hypothetical protein
MLARSRRSLEYSARAENRPGNPADGLSAKSPPSRKEREKGRAPDSCALAKGWASPLLKEETGAGRGGGSDLYKLPNGDIIVKGKGGIGPGEPTGININNL